MGDKQGWICLHRSIQDSIIWKDKPFDKGRAWIDLILMANHEDNRFLLGNEIVSVKRGSFITSELKLMDRWGWSKSKVRSYLHLLESESMIVKKTDHKKTTITIVKYCDYQDLQTTERPQKDHEKTTKKPRKDTNNNDNNDNNDKQKRRGTPSFEKPSLKEVRDYCKERNNHVDPQLFINFYESNGWMVGKNKMKDWKAAVRTWEQRIFEFKAKDSKRQYEFEQNTNYAELESKLLEN